MAGTAALLGALSKEMEGPLPRRYAFSKASRRQSQLHELHGPGCTAPAPEGSTSQPKDTFLFGAPSSLGATVRVGLQWAKRQEVSMRVVSSAAERWKQWHSERVQEEDMVERNTQTVG